MQPGISRLPSLRFASFVRIQYSATFSLVEEKRRTLHPEEEGVQEGGRNGELKNDRPAPLEGLGSWGRRMRGRVIRPLSGTDHALLASISCSKMRMGGFLPVIASSVMTTSLICFWDGASYMTSNITSSKMARSPRAPVF